MKQKDIFLRFEICSLKRDLIRLQTLTYPLQNSTSFTSMYLQIVLVLKSLQMYESTRLTVSIQIFSHVLAYTNLCIANPILYNCFSENFRKAFRKVSITLFSTSWNITFQWRLNECLNETYETKTLNTTQQQLELITKKTSVWNYLC